MKTKFTMLLLFIAVLSVKSQTMESLKSETDKMFQATFAMDYDKIFSFTYPKLFETMPAEQLKTVMKQTFDNEYMKITLEKIDPKFQFDPIQEMEGKKISVIRYKTAMTMFMKQNFSTDAERDVVVNALSGNELFSGVKLNKEKTGIYAEMDAVMIGIFDSTTGGQWKFINYTPAQREMYRNILSDTILNKLGL
ncbi:hypothetical protein [Flavobacterium sp. 3HN19-14]|uniref:hypothetical protein n=1 Tax=Flavobacterium sp. 3HN19-14 TaxID=3448133 RepID=UPI003EE38AFA